MKGKIRIGVIGAVLLLTGTAVVTADCGVASPYGYGAYGYFPSYVYVRDYIPYFALHPPVYYSLPVPRTYGYSPFAYPPGTMTPEVIEPEPLTVPNEFVPSKTDAKPEPGLLTAKPLRISNPYVLAENNGASAPGVAAR